MTNRKFSTWLKKQLKRDDRIGDLAHDTKGFYPDLIPQTNDYNSWELFLYSHQACDAALASLKQAFKEFEGKQYFQHRFAEAWFGDEPIERWDHYPYENLALRPELELVIELDAGESIESAGTYDFEFSEFRAPNKLVFIWAAPNSRNWYSEKYANHIDNKHTYDDKGEVISTFVKPNG